MNPLDVRVVDENGKEIGLRDTALGKWTVLYVYPKDNTPAAQQKRKSLQKSLQSLKSWASRLSAFQRTR